MQKLKLLQASIQLDKLTESKEDEHEFRIKMAKAVIDILNDFVAEEVRLATSKPKDDEHHMSWQSVADVMHLSKSATYTRYGGKN